MNNPEKLITMLIKFPDEFYASIKDHIENFLRKDAILGTGYISGTGIFLVRIKEEEFVLLKLKFPIEKEYAVPN